MFGRKFSELSKTLIEWKLELFYNIDELSGMEIGALINNVIGIYDFLTIEADKKRDDSEEEDE